MAGEISGQRQEFGGALYPQIASRDGMALLGMNWKKGKPPKDFVGFAIEHRPPDSDRFFALKNRITFPGVDGAVNPERLSTMSSPIQKFRWVHFPRNANLDGEFVYRVTPMFMNDDDTLSQGDPQEAAIELRRDTFPGQLNVTFTRGFVSSQAFVDRFEKFGPINKLVPAKAADGLKFKPTHPNADEALAWMGFEAREVILDTLDQAIKDKAEVRVVAYDLNVPDVVDAAREDRQTAENHHRRQQGARRGKVRRDPGGEAPQGFGGQGERDAPAHEKPSAQQDHRGRRPEGEEGGVRLDQSELARVLRAIQQRGGGGRAASRSRWRSRRSTSISTIRDGFGDSDSAKLTDLGLKDIDARVAFSPHAKSNSLLKKIGDDILGNTTSCLFYSLAFLCDNARRDQGSDQEGHQPQGYLRLRHFRQEGRRHRPADAGWQRRSRIRLGARQEHSRAVLQGAGGRRRQPHASQIRRHRFRQADRPGLSGLVQFLHSGRREERRESAAHSRPPHRGVLHHRGVAHLRPLSFPRRAAAGQEGQEEAAALARPPRKAGEKPWWDEDFTNARKIRDRELFA